MRRRTRKRHGSVDAYIYQGRMFRRHTHTHTHIDAYTHNLSDYRCTMNRVFSQQIFHRENLGHACRASNPRVGASYISSYGRRLPVYSPVRFCFRVSYLPFSPSFSLSPFFFFLIFPLSSTPLPRCLYTSFAS